MKKISSQSRMFEPRDFFLRLCHPAGNRDQRPRVIEPYKTPETDTDPSTSRVWKRRNIYKTHQFLRFQTVRFFRGVSLKNIISSSIFFVVASCVRWEQMYKIALWRTLTGGLRQVERWVNVIMVSSCHHGYGLIILIIWNCLKNPGVCLSEALGESSQNCRSLNCSWIFGIKFNPQIHRPPQRTKHCGTVSLASMNSDFHILSIYMVFS